MFGNLRATSIKSALFQPWLAWHGTDILATYIKPRRIITSITLLIFAATASAIEPPRLLIDRLFASFNRHDVAALQALYRPEARLSSSDFCKARSGTDVTRTYRAMLEAFPDIRDDVISVVVDGDQGIVRFRSSSIALEHAFNLS